MELNVKDRILTLKIVYYGPALGGKTTNLLTIHALTDKEKRTELISIATRDDRTLFFDLLPMGLGRHFGFELKMKLYTVPGQVQFDVTRRRVLAGADAVVFVADSQRSQEAANALSLKNMRINMNQNKLDPKTTAVVLQYNKRDLPDLIPVKEMDAALNEELKVPSIPAVATVGPGVMESLAASISRAIETVAAGRGLASPQDARRCAASIRETLMTFAVKDPAMNLTTGPPATAAAPAGSAQSARSASGAAPNAPAQAAGRASAAEKAWSTLAPQPPPSASAPGARQSAPSAPPARSGPGEAGVTWTHKAEVKVTDDVDLLDEAVKANLALSERIGEQRKLAELAAKREKQVRTLGVLARLAGESADPPKIELDVLALCLQSLGLSRGSLLAKTPSGRLGVRSVAGHGSDPLASIPSPPLGSVADRLIAAGRLLRSNDLQGEILFGEMHPALSGVFGLLFSPVQLADGSFGGLFLYGAEMAEEFEAADELFVEAACRIVSLVRYRVHGLVAKPV